MKLTDKFEKLPGIYIFTNLTNGKVYVGETINIKSRFAKHKSSMNKLETKQVITNAFIKYGVENFQVEVHYFPDFSKNDLLDLEEQLIKKFDCLAPKGYNVCPKGQDNSGIPKSEEHKRKISESHTGKVYSKERCEKMSKMVSGKRNPNYGKKHSQEAKLKMAQASKFTGMKHSEETLSKMNECKLGAKNPFFGKKHSEETKAKIIESSRLHKLNKGKPVIQINKETFEIIKIWPNVNEAACNVSSSKGSSQILKCLRGERNTSYGFKWEYLNP